MSPKEDKLTYEAPEESKEDAALRAESAGQDSFTAEQTEEFGSKAEEFVTPRERQNVPEGDDERREVPNAGSEAPGGGKADTGSQGGTLSGPGAPAAPGAPGTVTPSG